MKSLNQLSLSVGSIDENQVSRVVNAVCRKINEFIHPKLIRVYKKERSRTATILRPFSVISADEVEVETITILSEPQGIVSWCVHNQKTIWIEKVKESLEENSVTNNLDKSRVDRAYCEFTFDPDSLVVLPIKAEGELVGVLVVELTSSNVLKEAMVKEFEGLCIPLGRLIYRSTNLANQMRDTNRAIESFLNDLLGFYFSDTLKTGNSRTGFIARPFNDHFDCVGNIITETFRKSELNAIEYRPKEGAGLAIRGIQEQIKNAHFYIIDISGLNRNVLIELGLILSEEVNEKKCLIIRDKDDSAQLPFDVAGYDIRRYSISRDKNSLDIWNAGADTSLPFDMVLNKFVDDLKNISPDFCAAKPHR